VHKNRITMESLFYHLLLSPPRIDEACYRLPFYLNSLQAKDN